MLPLRVVAVGCGRVFERFHLPALRRGSEWSLCGVVDTDPERLRWAAAQVPHLPAGSSLSSLLEQVRPDAVLISTSPASHHVLAATALRSGSHVLLEKPMTLEPSDAEMLVSLAGSAGRQIRVGFNRRFRPGYATLRDLLARQARPIRSAHFELCTDPGAWRSCTPHPTRNGHGDDELLHDLASHQLDLLPWILGSQVLEVSARYLTRDAARRRIAIDLRLAGNMVASCVAGYQPGYVEQLQVEVDGGSWMAGPGGLVKTSRLFPSLASQQLKARALVRTVTGKLTGQPSDTLETFRRQLGDWARALRVDGGERIASGADAAAGARCVGLIDACRRSLGLDGRWIEAPPPQQRIRE